MQGDSFHIHMKNSASDRPACWQGPVPDFLAEDGGPDPALWYALLRKFKAESPEAGGAFGRIRAELVWMSRRGTGQGPEKFWDTGAMRVSKRMAELCSALMQNPESSKAANCVLRLAQALPPSPLQWQRALEIAEELFERSRSAGLREPPEPALASAIESAKLSAALPPGPGRKGPRL